MLGTACRTRGLRALALLLVPGRAVDQTPLGPNDCSAQRRSQGRTGRESDVGEGSAPSSRAPADGSGSGQFIRRRRGRGCRRPGRHGFPSGDPVPRLCRAPSAVPARRSAGTDDHAQRRDEQPQHEHDDRAERAVGLVVLAKVGGVDGEERRRGQPDQRGHDGADRRPRPLSLDPPIGWRWGRSRPPRERSPGLGR